ASLLVWTESMPEDDRIGVYPWGVLQQTLGSINNGQSLLTAKDYFGQPVNLFGATTPAQGTLDSLAGIIGGAYDILGAIPSDACSGNCNPNSDPRVARYLSDYTSGSASAIHLPALQGKRPWHVDFRSGPRCSAASAMRMQPRCSPGTR